MSHMAKEQLVSYFKLHKQDFADNYGVVRVGIFGSAARDELLETSDIDIAIEMIPEKKISEIFWDLNIFLNSSSAAESILVLKAP